MAEKSTTGFTKTTMIVAIAAAIGWLLALYFFLEQRDRSAELDAMTTQRASVQQELEAERAASGELQQLNASIEQLTRDTEQATERQATLQDELAQLTAQRDSVQADLDDVIAQRDTGQADVEQLEAQAQPLRIELDEYEARRAELESQVAAQSDALIEVGTRLEEARTREAEVQQALSDLTNNMVTLTEEALQAETALQAALQQSAETEQTTAQLREEVIALEAQALGLTDEIARLSERQTMLAEDVSSTLAQRNEMQAILGRLTEQLAVRSQDLLRIERQIEELVGQQNAMTAQEDAAMIEDETGATIQQDGAVDDVADQTAPPPAPGDQDAAVLAPGQYVSDDGLTATFTDDGTFEITSGDQNWTGQYVVENTILQLEASQDGVLTMGETRASCEILPLDDGGFQIADDQTECGNLAGRSFAPAQE
jgi:uncharacterized coiled-coil protein SlyX